jgi:two-component system phosphate regulon sensor histidine kinase PhoR
LADALLELSDDGIAVLDGDATIARWNRSAAEFTGIATDDAVGASARDVFGNADALLDVPANSQSRRCEATFGTGPKKRTLRAIVFPIEGGRGGGGWVVSFAPQRRHAEIEQLKSEFVGAISHELKTPLATIKAFAETIRVGGLSPDQTAEYLLTIDEQTDRLARTIDDLLSLSRVESDQLLARRVAATVDTVLDRALDIVAAASGSRPTIEREATGATVSGDPDLIAQALSQIIDNAAKFSAPASPISIRAEQREDGCAISVTDLGIGIALEHVAYIFDRFYRIDPDLNSPVGGTGVGLFIANALVRAHGGTIYVVSRLDVGSTFTLWFPVRA